MRSSRLVLPIAFIVISFALGFVVGGYRKTYLSSSFDLVATASTELKLRNQSYEVLQYENALRLWSAYQTIQSLPSWTVIFRPSAGLPHKRQEELLAVMHDVLLKHFKSNIDKRELEAFVQSHLGERSK